MLFNRKGSAVALGAGVVALSLIAAEGTAATPAVGTASSSLDAVTLTVTGVDLPAVTLLQAGTFASTDPDAPGNILDAPWASASIAPVLIDGVAQGGHEATSDGSSSGSSEAVDVAGVASMAPVTVAATATAESARATIGAAEGSLAVLTDALGVTVSSLGVDSVVDANGASNSQGIAVSGLDLTLGDLLPADLLAALPIDVLVDLLAQLPIDAPDVQAIADAVTQLAASLQAGVDAVIATSGSIEESVAALEDAVADFDAQQAIADTLEADLADAEAALTNLEANVTAAVAAAADVANSTAGLACVTNNPLDPAAAAACIAALQADADAAVTAAQAALAAGTDTVDQLTADLAEATSLLAPLAQVVDTLTDLVNELVATLVDLVNALLADLGDLVGALTNLNTSLADIVDGLADTTLLGVGNLELTMSAIAGATADASSAGIVCDLSGLVVAGVDLGGGSCEGDSLTGSLTAALGSLDSVLGALPLVGELVPTVSIDLMSLSSSVTEADGVVTSTATVVPMVIDLPSVTLDPAAIVDGLLSDLTGLLDGLVAGLPTSDLLAGVGLDAAAATITDLTGVQVPQITDLQATVADIVAQLPLGDDLLAFTTPGFNLQIDPTSTATFAPGTAAAPAPTPESTPLPATGGGAVLLAALGLGGSWSLRRRR